MNTHSYPLLELITLKFHQYLVPAQIGMPMFFKGIIRDKNHYRKFIMKNPKPKFEKMESCEHCSLYSSYPGLIKSENNSFIHGHG